MDESNSCTDQSEKSYEGQGLVEEVHKSPQKRKPGDEGDEPQSHDASSTPPIKRRCVGDSDTGTLQGSHSSTKTTENEGGDAISINDDKKKESLDGDSDSITKVTDDSITMMANGSIITKVTGDSITKVTDAPQEGKDAPESTSSETSEETKTSQGPLADPLSYTKADEFTSEIYKIQIHNMPRFGFNQLKKRLVSLGLKPNKLKSPSQKVTYICFRNDADRQDAIAKLNGHVWKGRSLEVKEAAPVADPFLKRRQEAKNSGSDADDLKKDIPEKQPMTPEEAREKLRSHVIPLWNVDYSKQLEMKTEKIKEVLTRIPKHPSVKDQFMQIDGFKRGDTACPLLPIVPSPITSHYRNKNEFTVGYGLDGTTVQVGFRYGLYKDGTTSVGEVDGLENVMPAALPVVKSFQTFVSQSKWTPFLQQTGTGHWHTLTVRTFLSGDVMVMADFAPRTLDTTEIDEAKAAIKEFYATGEGKDVSITSFHFRLVGKDQRSANKSQKLEHIFGESHVHESLLGFKFRISPEAFFQINTPAAECLYRQIGEWSQVTDSSTVLDVCCGTGTIGLSMAKRCKEVIGIEMCRPAVEDAKVNAELNGLANASFSCAKVEDVIGRIISSLDLSSLSSPTSTPRSTQAQSDVVAVVDPPRAGLHKNVIKTLRRCREIQRLIYVSCNPESAMENFVDLIRPATGKHKGPPFTLVKAVPVDLFPGTMHCELVLLFTHQDTET